MSMSGIRVLKETDVMENTVNDRGIFQSVTQAYLEKKKLRVLPTGVKPMTFKLLVQMF